MIRWVLLAALLAGRAAADESLISFRARAIAFEVHGDVESGDDDNRFVRGPTRGLREDFELERGLWISADLSLNLGERDRVGAIGLYGAARGDREVDEPFRWNDNDYVPGEGLAQEISYGNFSIAYQHRVVASEEAALWAGVGLSLTNTNVALRVRHPLVPHVDENDGERIRTLFPAVFLSGHLSLARDLEGFCDLRAGAFGLDVFDESGDGRFLWAEAGVRWQPLRWLSLELGLDFLWSRTTYRGREAGGGDFDIIRYELRLVGPSLGVTIRF